jgi:hypothetical protein
MLADGITISIVLLSTNIGPTDPGQHLLLFSSSIKHFGSVAGLDNKKYQDSSKPPTLWATVGQHVTEKTNDKGKRT